MTDITMTIRIEGKEKTTRVSKGYSLSFVPLPGMCFLDPNGPPTELNKELGYKVKLRKEDYCVFSNGHVLIEIVDDSHVESNKSSFEDYVMTFLQNGWFK